MTAVALPIILGAVVYVMAQIARLSLHQFAVWSAGDTHPSADAGGKPAKEPGS